MEKKVFPIQNESACAFKWGWNTFRLYTGVSSSCHRVQGEVVPLEQFENFHNMPNVIDDRIRMSQNQWPKDREFGRGCEYCKNVESTGGVSDRLFHKGDLGITPVDFDKDQLHVTQRIQEIYLNNTCDLACVYCVPHFSSKINEELKQFGPMTSMPDIIPVNRVEDHSQYLDKMIEWLDKNWANLHRFILQGGEPFLQKEFWTMFDHIEKLKNPELEFSVNSNLNTSGKIIESFVPRVKKLLAERRIKRFDITCSIDCWGPQQEFVRYGLDLTNWQKNFEFLLQHRWLYISTGQTVTSLSIKTLPVLQKKLNGYLDQGYKFNQVVAYVDGKTQYVYDPVIFGGDFFVNELTETLDLMPSTNDHQRHVKDRFNGILQYVKNSQPDRLRLSNLHQTLDQIDYRRGSNWKTIFPEIHQYFLENKIPNVV